MNQVERWVLVLASAGLASACGGTARNGNADSYELAYNQNGNVIVTPAYLGCTADLDCILVDTSCASCCDKASIRADRKATYDKNFESACSSYSGAICDCAVIPSEARCIKGACEAVRVSGACTGDGKNCLDGCVAFGGSPLDVRNSCLDAPAPLGCWPENEPVTDDIGCIKSASGTLYELSSGSHEALAEQPGFERCSPAQESDVVGTKPCSSGTCAGQGERCTSGKTCCGGLTCCAGVPVPPGSEFCGSICPISDRNLKRNFESVDPNAVLEKVASLPVSTWGYTTETGSVRHMGPMAQDFQAAFGLGESDRTILQVDADGVALVSIQALHAQLLRLASDNAALRERLDALEARSVGADATGCSGSK